MVGKIGHFKLQQHEGFPFGTNAATIQHLPKLRNAKHLYDDGDE